MPQPNDLSRSLVALDHNSTIIAVVELSQSSWLVGGVLPGIERQPRKKLEPSPERLLAVLHRWRDEAIRAGCNITRIALAFEAGRDGFWLARWLAARGVEAHVIHPSSVAVSREHRRAKTDRLDTELLKRGFLGWLRGERGHCSMVRVPTLAEEDAKRPNRERECLVKERTRLVNRMKGALARLGIRNFRPTLRNAAEHLAGLYTPEGSPLPPNVAAELERDIARLGLVIGQIKQLEAARRQRLEEQPESRPHAMVRLLVRVVGIGTETADMLVNEVLSRPLRDRRAVARYAGLTGVSRVRSTDWRSSLGILLDRFRAVVAFACTCQTGSPLWSTQRVSSLRLVRSSCYGSSPRGRMAPVPSPSRRSERFCSHREVTRLIRQP